jgi:hypothetical protein
MDQYPHAQDGYGLEKARLQLTKAEAEAAGIRTLCHSEEAKDEKKNVAL